MRLDHISYACHSNELADVVQRIGVDLGTHSLTVGDTPRLVPETLFFHFAHGVYIEVVSALDHPSAQKSPIRSSSGAKSTSRWRLMSWVVSTTDLSPVEQELGRKAAEGHPHST